jgi:hypothetical protein
MGAGAVDPSLAVSVVQVVGALAAFMVAVVGLFWRGFVWLDKRIAGRIAGWADGKEFKAAVAEIVTQAFAATADINNRLHEEHRRSIGELRKRDEERLDAIKRLHGRVDSVWERVAK